MHCRLKNIIFSMVDFLPDKRATSFPNKCEEITGPVSGDLISDIAKKTSISLFPVACWDG